MIGIGFGLVLMVLAVPVIVEATKRLRDRPPFCPCCADKVGMGELLMEFTTGTTKCDKCGREFKMRPGA